MSCSFPVQSIHNRAVNRRLLSCLMEVKGATCQNNFICASQTDLLFQEHGEQNRSASVSKAQNVRLLLLLFESFRPDPLASSVSQLWWVTPITNQHRHQQSAREQRPATLQLHRPHGHNQRYSGKQRTLW